MKIKRLFLGLLAILALSPTIGAFADTQDFYFSDFSADYYLSKNDDGTSVLHVKEVLTAVFPDFDQNHGIMREIPFRNQNGKNRTVESLEALNLKVLRNGKPETVNKVLEQNGFYAVYIGDATEYVRGEQIYTLEYTFTDVITEFTASGENVSGREGIEKAFQELYWDTNGTAWRQRFDHISARLHVPTEIYNNMTTQAWCYVGYLGSNNQSRCTIKQTSDGFSFEAEDLLSEENLTFATQFKPGTFEVVIEKNYILVWILVAEVVFIAFLLARKYLKWRKEAKPQYDLYKSLFDTPEYQPPQNKDVNVAEAEQVYIKKTNSSYVATLLELAVSRKITIKKAADGQKYNWTIILNVEKDALTGPQTEMLNILYGKSGLQKGMEIPIRKHKATRFLADCASSYKTSANDTMVFDGFLQEEKSTKKSSILSVLVFFIAIIFMYLILPNVLRLISKFVVSELGALDGNSIMVGGEVLLMIEIALFVAALIISAIIQKKINVFKKYTESGIRLVKYLEGLELYIKMAEADRLKFLQSVEGVDTSSEGIVKLYEKLLPWASLFGAEESWVKELAKYYQIESVDETLNADVLDGFISASISRELIRSIARSTNYVEPSSSSGNSGGSWSSSSSGGGGGGFSGGGGGGGGGGGW